MATSITVGLTRPMRNSVYRPVIWAEIVCRGVTSTAHPFMLNEQNTLKATNLPETSTSYVKPFSQVPGLRVLPIIGTAWGMFPHIGINSFMVAL